MNKQTWYITKFNKESTPVPSTQIRSFEDYAAQVKVKKLANQMLIDNLMNQLAAYKAAPLINDVAAKLDTLQDSLKPSIKFFSESKEKPKKQLTKAERIAAIIEEQERKLNQDSLNRINKGAKA